MRLPQECLVLRAGETGTRKIRKKPRVGGVSSSGRLVSIAHSNVLADGFFFLQQRSDELRTKGRDMTGMRVLFDVFSYTLNPKDTAATTPTRKTPRCSCGQNLKETTTTLNPKPSALKHKHPKPVICQMLTANILYNNRVHLQFQ